MGLSADLQKKLLSNARSLIGQPYDTLPCNEFVHKAFLLTGLKYEKKKTTDFPNLKDKTFVEVDFKKKSVNVLEPGDIILFQGHMGIWDPQGCTYLPENKECGRFKGDLPFLSSRTANNRGPDFGKIDWFGKVKAVYRWK